LKNKTLIISDSQPLIDRIETLFSNQDWLAESMSTHSIIGQGSASMMDYRCAIFVIDNNFRKHFSGLITEMSAFIRNASVHTPIYLVFEYDEDAAFSTWLNHVKKTFESVIDQSRLLDAIQNIIRIDSYTPRDTAPLIGTHY
jgi:hypothetical protein